MDQLEGGNGGENEQQAKEVRDQLKQIVTFLIAIIAMASAILLAFLNGAKDMGAMHSPAVIKAYSFLIWLTIQSPIMSMMYAIFLLGHYNRINQSQKIYLISAIAMSCVLLIVTSLFSLVLQNKDNARMSLIAIPVICTMCFLGYRATQNVNDDDRANHGSIKREKKKAFKFATAVSTMAITIETSMIYASFKTPPPKESQSFQLALSLFFLISMVGIFVMMVTSIPLTVHYSSWISFVRYSSATILVLLGLSAAALAMQFLESMVVGVFLLVLLPICVYFAQKHPSSSPTDPTSSQYHVPSYAGVTRYGIVTLVSFNGVLLAAICTASVEQYYKSLGLRVCAFLQLLAFESGLIWLGLMFEPRRDAMWASIFEIFYSVSLLLQIVMIMAGAVMLFIVLP